MPWISCKERTCQGSQISARCRAHCGGYELTGRSTSITTWAIREVYCGAFKQANLIVFPVGVTVWRCDGVNKSALHTLTGCWRCRLSKTVVWSCWTKSKTIERLMVMWGDESAACTWVRTRSTHTVQSLREKLACYLVTCTRPNICFKSCCFKTSNLAIKKIQWLKKDYFCRSAENSVCCLKQNHL